MNEPGEHIILVVDDNESGRYVKTRLLQRHGYKVFEAGDGEETLRLVRQKSPSLVVLDVKLPDMSGIDVCRKIKSLNSSILVLQTSAAFTGKRDRAAGLAGGANSYLVEPFEPEEFTATIVALLRLYASERELHRANDTLEENVRRRTQEIEAVNEQLREEIAQQIKAEEMVRHTQKLDVLGQLTGGIAHDFNNLLMIILGNLESLRRQFSHDSHDEERIGRNIENALTGARRAASLTQHLMAFARRQPLDPKPLNVNDLILGMSDVLRRSLGEHISVVTELTQTPYVVNADRNQLENALLNLAINARDAMSTGGKLVIRTANVDLTGNRAAGLDVAAGPYLSIDVIDTGIGMSPDVLDHAVEPFFTTKDVGHGTGLGLSQVYGFVTQSGGNVVIDSAVDKGTRVGIYLPRTQATAVADDVGAKSAERGAGEMVLVVEDDPDVRRQTSSSLVELGYKVVEAATGTAALTMLDTFPDISLLFTDVGLPGGMSGPELVEKARRRNPGLKVLLTTGYGLNSKLPSVQALQKGHLLRKPFTFVDLAVKLRECIKGVPLVSEETHLRGRE